MDVPVFMKCVRRVVVDRFGDHGTDDADFIGDAAQFLEQAAETLPGFAEFLEFMLGGPGI